MIKRNLKLSDEARYICQKYIDTGEDLEKTAKLVGKDKKILEQLIKGEHYKRYIDWRRIVKMRKDKNEYEYKQYKLKKVYDTFIPEHDDLEPKKVSVAIQAIAESNKMAATWGEEMQGGSIKECMERILEEGGNLDVLAKKANLLKTYQEVVTVSELEERLKLIESKRVSNE